MTRVMNIYRPQKSLAGKFMLGLMVMSLTLWGLRPAGCAEFDPLDGSLPSSLEEVHELLKGKVVDSLTALESDVREVLQTISQKIGVLIKAEDNVQGKITLSLNDVSAEDALRIIMDVGGLAYNEEGGILRVIPRSDYETIFGKPFGDGKSTLIIPLANARVADITGILQAMKSEDGKVIVDEVNNKCILIDTQDKLASLAPMIKDLDVPKATEIFQLKYIKGSDVVNKIRPILTGNVGRVQLDERSNNIVVTDTSAKVKEIGDLIRKWDQKANEITLQSKILQITLNNEHPLGVDWEAIVNGFQSMDFDGLETEENGKGKLSFGTVSVEDYEVLLEALDTVGALNTISDENIPIKENESGIVTVKASDLSFKSGEPQHTEAGKEEVRFNVAPTINDEKSVTIRIKPQAVSREEIGNDNQSLAERAKNAMVKATTRIISLDVREGQTIVIGGLFKEVTIELTKKIPLLGDLPFLGFVFRKQNERILKSEIVVFLTPKIEVEQNP